MSRRVLVLGTALAEAFAALVEDDRIVIERRVCGGRGLAERLPSMIDGLIQNDVTLIAALVGPGSFTGIRAGLALAHGLSFGADCPVVGVTVGEAVREGLGWRGALWVATDARREHIFLEGDGPPRPVAIADLTLPAAMPLLAGDRADRVEQRLAALGGLPRIAARPLPGALGVADAARARLDGRLEPLPCLPLYIDAPDVSGPAAGRPPPA